jgi:hypothetical protein
MPTPRGPLVLHVRDQVAELLALSTRIGDLGFIRYEPGDVAALDIGDGIEVCHADGSYDIWLNGCPTRHHSLTLEEAVAVLSSRSGLA